MNDLLQISFRAQCNYVERRIHDVKKRRDFNWATNLLASFGEVPQVRLNEGSDMAYEIYRETKRNLTARFVTGEPIDGWSIYE